MSSDEPSERSPDAPDGEEPLAGAGNEPAVGNVLGFSLLFRERRALLALNRRSLGPGVRLRDYEAVIPGVGFPLRGPLMATKFRNRRCRLVRAALTIEERTLLPWLRARLVDLQPRAVGVRIREVELDLRRELPEAERPRPCLMIAGDNLEGGRFWLLVGFDVEPVHRLLILRPCRLWLVGHLPQPATRGLAPRRRYGGTDASIDGHGRDASARRLWRALAQHLAAGPIAGVASAVTASDDGTLRVDVARLALTRAFASVGWKAPNLEGSAVAALGLSRRAVSVELRGPVTDAEVGEGDEDEVVEDRHGGRPPSTPASDPEASDEAKQAVAAVPGEPGLLDEPIARALDRARELLRAARLAERGDTDSGITADIGPALMVLGEISEALGEFPAARLAVVRWRVELARFLDRGACLAAVYEWLDLQPSAAEPRRLLAVLLAAEGRAQELARLLAADCRQPHPPLTQARLELAVASLLIDRLDDPRSALTIVGPLCQRLREQIGGRERRARARPSQRARESADEGAALASLLPEALVVLARARIAEVVREGRSLAAVPHVLAALDEALEATINPRRRADLRARVAEVFADAGDRHDDRGGDEQALALLRAAIEDDPDDLELLDQAIELALRVDQRAAAADLLRRRLAAAAVDERAGLRKRLIAIAAELDDRELRELARRELAIALEQEPNNVALLRRAAALERDLGRTAAAADFLGRLLELDEFAEVELDDRDLLVLERATLLERAGRVDAAWECLRGALARIPPGDVTIELDEDELPWILDVLELGLELAPPTDRPRILDLLITWARGQRRGEALVERAAQALRIEERLDDLWLALGELERPEKILAQIEQLLDDRDHEGLARLAEVAASLGEGTTELHARVRLGRSLLGRDDDVEDGAIELERAVELAPERLDLRADLARAYERLDRPDLAAPQLERLLAGAGREPPDTRARLALRLAAALRESGGAAEAAQVLAGIERELARADPQQVAVELREAVAEQSFAALRQQGEDERALLIALEQVAGIWIALEAEAAKAAEAAEAGAVGAGPESLAQARRRGLWLARAGQVLDDADVEALAELPSFAARPWPETMPRTRAALLTQALRLRPDDVALAELLEQVLRRIGDDIGLEQHLRWQIERHADPDTRAALLERLLALVESDPEVGARGHELAELLEELLALRPGHSAAMLTLGRLRFEQGDAAQARQLWAVAGASLDADDPRLYEPALELARHALDVGELEQARAWAERARDLEPDAREPAELLAGVAGALDDPELLALTLGQLLATAREAGGDASASAALELELAWALARWHEREPNPARARAALEHFELGLRGVEDPAAVVAAARRALALAEGLGDALAQARTRATLRRELGAALGIDELLAEIELLDRDLDQPLVALERLEQGLSERAGEPQLLAGLAQLLLRRGDRPELAQRAQRSLRSSLTAVADPAARSRIARLLVDIGRRLDEPAAVAFALDQLALVEPELVEVGDFAELREWAVRKLGRVQEEIGSVESRLADARVEAPRRRALVERLLGLLDDDRLDTAGRLIDLCEQAEREAAVALAEEALHLLADALAAASVEPASLRLSLAALRILARVGADEALLARWDMVEAAARRSESSEPLAALVGLAGAAASQVDLGERADALLVERLPAHPDDPKLLAAVWGRAEAAVLVLDGEQGRAEVVSQAAAWLERLLDRYAIEPVIAARMFAGLATQVEREVDADAAAAMLRERAEAHLRDAPALFSALLEALRGRRRWPELLSLLQRAGELDPAPAQADQLGPWQRLAAAAGEDGDQASELRARIRVAELWLADSAARFDEGAGRRAQVELERALALAPERADLRWRLGTLQARLGAARPAYELLIGLWDDERWSEAGVELGELALRCGTLAAELGERERAVELLTVAHARSDAERSEQVTELLVSALLLVDRRDEVVRLAAARAAELDDPEAAVQWLHRAAELAAGPRRVELLTRARELSPEDDILVDELEAELLALGEFEALESLLRERLARCREAAGFTGGPVDPSELDPDLRDSWHATLGALITLIGRVEDQRGEGEGESDGEGEGATGEGEGPRRGEQVRLHEELLLLDPDDTASLMVVAEDRRRHDRRAEALELWARAEPALADDDPRLFEVACGLAERELARDRPALDQGARQRAHQLLERALALRPDDVGALERRHEVACALDVPKLVLAAAESLLALPAGIGDPRRAELEADVARAQTLLDRPAAALAALERALALVSPGGELHRELAQRTLELLESAGLRALPEAEVAADLQALGRRELAARAELRRASGVDLDRAAALRELELMVALGELDPALELLESLLIAAPADPELRARLRALAEAQPGASASAGEGTGEGASDRTLRSLRRVIDALPAGPIRDDLARELARSAHGAEAARTTLEALDRLSGQAAAEAEMLDLRVWAVRKLDRVEDELGELERLLAAVGEGRPVGSPGDPVLLERLLRLLERDAEACATRLIDLAARGQAAREQAGTGAPVPAARIWLLESSLALLFERAPEALGLGVRALGDLLELLADPAVLLEVDADERAARERVAGARRRWQQLAATALTAAGRDRRALDTVVALVEIADRSAAAELPGFADVGDMLLDRATVDFPDHGPLHALAARREHERGGDPSAALERIERLADAHRMDPRGRARLYLGLAATFEAGPRAALLRDLAGYHADEPAIFAPLREALRKQGAFVELAALLESVGADAEQWLDLADDAAAAGETGAEGVARRAAGLALFDRVLAEERAGGGLSETTLDRACDQLARARALCPEDLEVRYAHGRALERAGRAREALDELEGVLALLAGDDRESGAGEAALAARGGTQHGLLGRAVEVGPLARRCGLLALELDERPRARELLQLAYDRLEKPRARLAVAERLFPLVAAAADGGPSAVVLAGEAAALAVGPGARGEPGEALTWLDRAARTSDDPRERADFHARAHALAPEDERIADAYEASLRALDDRAALATLLRGRVALGLDSGDRARTVALLERLLSLLDPIDEVAGEQGETTPEARAALLARIRERAELLEQLLRLAPERIDPRLELAALRMREGDREAAAAHWRGLAQRLPDPDRRFLEPARALARLAADVEEYEQARRWLERALAIEPGARDTLLALLEVARRLEDPTLLLETSDALLAARGETPRAASLGLSAEGGVAETRGTAETGERDDAARAALLRERARAFERLEQFEPAIAALRRAIALEPPQSPGHVEAAEHWLRLVTREGMRVLLREDRGQAEAEAEARAELRRALGDRLPPRAYAVEAALLADRLDRREQAIALAIEALQRYPGDADLLAGLEELCAVAGEQARFVRFLSGLLSGLLSGVGGTGTGADEDHRGLLAEKLARAARAIDDPHTCLEALDALPPALAERPELLELRDWAVRGLGNVDEELARLEARVLATVDLAGERLQPLIGRMLRLLGDAGEPCARRLLDLSARADTPELAQVLARTALRIAREYAPDQLDVAIAALRATIAGESIKAIAAWWIGVEHLALDAGQLEALVALLALAIEAEAEGEAEADYGPRADRLTIAALRLEPGAVAVHRLVRGRSGSGSGAGFEAWLAALDRLVVDLELRGSALARFWSGAAAVADEQAEHEDAGARLVTALAQRAEAALDDAEAFAGLLGLLRGRGQWGLVFDLLIDAGERRGPVTTTVFEELARQAGDAGDPRTRQRARLVVGDRLAAEGDAIGAAESYADALATVEALAADSPASRISIQLRLGDALALAGRADAALEQLLPLLEIDREGDLDDETVADPRLEPVALARRCAELLRAVDQLDRAAAVFERALAACSADDAPARRDLLEALFQLQLQRQDPAAAVAVAERALAARGEPPRGASLGLSAEGGVAETRSTLAARGEPPRGASLGLSAEGGVAETSSTPGTGGFRLLPLDENPGARRHDGFHDGLLARVAEVGSEDEAQAWRVRWLLRIADHGDPRRRLEALSQAQALCPEDEALAARLEQVLLEGSDDEGRLEVLLRSRVEQARIAIARLGARGEEDGEDAREHRARGAESLRKLIDLTQARRAEADEGEAAPALADLWRRLLSFEPEAIDARLALAELLLAEDPAAPEAHALWREVGERLPWDDERFHDPALALARAALEADDFAEARTLLERAQAIQPGEREVLELLHTLAVRADDPELQIHTVEALLEQPDHAGDQRPALMLEAGRAQALLAHRESLADADGEVVPSPARIDAAIRMFERASAAVTPGDPLHLRVAEAWLALVATGIDPLVGDPANETGKILSPAERDARIAGFEREAAARAQLRAALGAGLSPVELSPADLRLEANVLVIGLGRVDEGLGLIEAALLASPGEALLLSAFKDLCLATGAQQRYADVLEATIASLPAGGSEQRDRLATELAFTAVELEDAPRLLAQLERMSPQRASSPELLDLREWAIRKLGRVEDELGEIDEELLAAADPDEAAILVARLLRMLEQDLEAAGRRLVMLAGRAEPAVARRLCDAVFELVRSAEPSFFDVLIAALEQSLQDQGGPSPVLSASWPAFEKLAIERDDPGALALLLEQGMRAVAVSCPGEAPATPGQETATLDARALADLRRRVDEFRDFALIRHPDSPELHALILGPLEVELAKLERETRLTRADAALDHLASRLSLSGGKRAQLWVGFSQLLDRRDGAALLTRRARQSWDNDAMFTGLLDALEQGNHWTRALELLEHRVGRDHDEARKVGDLKHLAHLCADILGDPDAAIAHLERALVHDPEDPDLMLPLLDHYYIKPQLDRAIELSEQVLEQVPMGAVAYAALGHRAADAALATGEHALAERLLRKILARVPDEARTRDRLRELESLAVEPEHRARMLAAIANRTAGSARVEALEERARLLIDPLGRLEEAIADLEAVNEEAPGRSNAIALLAELYEQRQRWTALVALLEREFPRQQGLDRVLTLERVAVLQRERVGDLPRAEKALRLALENLDGLSEDRALEQLAARPVLLEQLLPAKAAEDEGLLPDDAGSALADFDTDALFDRLVEGEGDGEAVRAPTGDGDGDGEDEPTRWRRRARQALAGLGDRLHLQLVEILERRGRFSELIAHLETELAAELRGEADPRSRFPGVRDNPRLQLLQRLAASLRDHVDDGERTARVYVVLEQLDALPDDGLATLARWYRSQQRYDDLVRILTVRSRKLAQLGDWDRKSEADFRIGELLEGPLRRPHEAARFFLDAYLANPLDNPQAGARARVLLAGTDSVVNVRNRLLARLGELVDSYRPALLTLLADLLAPHDDHEAEAEHRYRQALEIDAELAGALEGLGRLLARQGRLEEAIEPLTRAAASPDLPDDRAADDAASAARALIELDRTDEAEVVLQTALARAPQSQRALLELARLYDRLARKADQAAVLDRLAALPLSSMLRAEVGYRQAMLLADDFRDDPMSEAGERARALLLEAVGADVMHAQARQALLDLAGARSEWSIVAHMHFLAIRELPPGPRRALTHLDLADTYLDRLSDAQSAVRNLAAALQQAPADVVVINRANVLAARVPEPGEAAARLEQIAGSPARPDLGEVVDDAGRARLLLFAADLHLRNDTLEPAQAAAAAANALPELPEALRRATQAQLERLQQIDQGEFDLRKRRKQLGGELEQQGDPLARLQLIIRMRETARSLGDRADLEDCTRRQLEVAHALLEGDARPEARDAALASLRDVFAESGDYLRVVRLYEDLAARSADANVAAELLTSAARFAWSGLRDPKLAVAIVRRALDRAPTHTPATELLGEIAGASDEREVDATICDELSQLAPRQRPPLLTLRLAEAALRLERREQAQGVLRQLLAGEAPVELRLQALSLLDGLLDAAGRTHDRIPLLEERLELCRRHWPDRAADVALELARSQRATGNLMDARATCRMALLDKPSDQPLTKLYAELLEQAEDWNALARALEQLANLTIETGEQAHWLTRAAQVHLDHGSDGRESMAAARRLLERARAVSIESTETRAVLMPLTFHQGDWERVIELAIELRAIAGDAHEALIFAALTEAFARGKRTLARSIGDRHDREVRQRVLWPTTARMLDMIAFDGPLPRLDAVLAAAAALCGGTEELLDELGAWAAGQPLQAGLALGLARLNEAFRRMELARHLYQIAAFMAPSGPVPVLTTRLPPADLPKDPVHEDSWVPLEWRGALRQVLLQIEPQLAGIRGHGDARGAHTPKERLAVQHASRLIGPWRAAMKVDFAIAVSEAPLPGGVGLRNLSRPTLVVSESFVDVPEAERRYRLAFAAAALATGLAVIYDGGGLTLPDLLDALLALATPRHEPATDTARGLVDTLAARGLTASKLDADLRRALARELDHWRGAPAKLERVLHRSCMLIAARLSGTVDGALMATARDRGLMTIAGRPGDPAVLETTDAAWLLRALGIFGGQG